MRASLSASTPISLASSASVAASNGGTSERVARCQSGIARTRAVEDREGGAARHLEMQAPRERLPGLVHEARALVEEAAPVAVHHDAVGIEQHHRRLVVRARIDRLDVHAVRLAGEIRAERLRHADAVAGVEMRARREQRHAAAVRAEMLAHHRGVGLEAAAGEDRGVGRKRLAGGEPHARDRAVVVGDQRLRRAANAEDDAGVARGAA